MQKKYLFVSDFDKTLSIDDNGELLSGRLGISPKQFKDKVDEITRRNIVQLGGELFHLFLRDEDYIGKVNKELLRQVGKEIKLKKDVAELFRLLTEGIDGFMFCPYVVSAAPQEMLNEALKGILPEERIFGSKLVYDKKGVFADVERTNAAHAKVATVDMLRDREKVPHERIIYVGDGASDIHVMLHILSYQGYPITVSPAPYMGHICRRTVLSDNVLSILIPILEDVVKMSEHQIRDFFEDRGHSVKDWSRAKTEWVDLEE
jgi:2-hydroxy-3-keto-5-methylthiopentenyl-1-phosphate phosphatase